MGSVRGDEAALPLWVGNADEGCLTSYDKVTDCCESAKLRESSGSRGWPVVRSTEAVGPAVPVVASTGMALGPGDRAAPVGRVGGSVVLIRPRDTCWNLPDRLT